MTRVIIEVSLLRPTGEDEPDDKPFLVGGRFYRGKLEGWHFMGVKPSNVTRNEEDRIAQALEDAHHHGD